MDSEVRLTKFKGSSTIWEGVVAGNWGKGLEGAGGVKNKNKKKLKKKKQKTKVALYHVTQDKLFIHSVL